MIYSNEYLRLNAELRVENWEGWPVKSFRRFAEQPGFVSTKCFEAGKRLIEKIKSGSCGVLVMIGQSGRGKTYTALQVLAEAAHFHKNCCAFRFPQMVEWSRMGFTDDGYYQKKLIARKNYIISLDVVLLDEIGDEVGKNSDHAFALLTNIYEKMQGRKTLIMTSNMTREQLSAYLPVKLKSRLFSWGKTTEDVSEMFVYEPPGTEDLRTVNLRKKT